ncbi:alpha/beta-hydrolase [Violaceomyces palustris]|uniref:Alpha/beta-hydrolase n=1 Tax=Violaceomyces palustris TaxID=1673888 RepID=A0ACD0NSC4_9BASI|nr:alpha/beta-hydrolase [Violaceomyces palustris]
MNEQLLQFARVVRENGKEFKAPQPDLKETVRCPFNQRLVDINVYFPPTPSGGSPKGPVVINWHGSGWTIPGHGKNEPYILHFSKRLKDLGLIFVDSDYSKAPEFPFPNALHEGVSVIRWALTQPFCDGRLILSGFSSGGNLSIVLSNSLTGGGLGLDAQELKSIKACIAFYPPTDAGIPTEQKETNEKPLPPEVPGTELSRWIYDGFLQCYTYTPSSSTTSSTSAPTEASMMKDPRISPIYSPASSFTVPITVITCSHDPLAEEGLRFHDHISSSSSSSSPSDLLHVHHRAEGVGHGFERRLKSPDQPGFQDQSGHQAVKSSYDLVETRIRQALSKPKPTA